MNEEFNGAILYNQWFWVRTLQYRILIQTTETHWRKVGQPAKEAQAGDQVVETHLDFITIEADIGVDRVTWQDEIIAGIVDGSLGQWLNQAVARIRERKPYENKGQLLHPNWLIR